MSAFVLVGVAALVWTGGAGLADSVRSTVSDPMAVFAARSPGVRPAGAKVQIKAPRRSVAASRGMPLGTPVPTASGLAVVGSVFVYERPAEVLLPQEETVSEIALPDSSASFPGPGSGLAWSGVPSSGAVVAYPPSAIAFVDEQTVPGLASAVVPLPAGGGGSSPVPEPSSWMTMILGFGFVGAVLRRYRGREARMR